MFQSSVRVLDIPMVEIRDDGNLPNGCALSYVVLRVRKKKQAKWWHLRREHWILRAGIQANQRIYKPQTEADAVWGNLPWGPKDDLAREFINRLTPDIEGYSTRFHKGIIIKEGNGYLVHSGARGEPDNVAIKLLRMVGLPAKAFGTTDESPPMPST